MYRLPPQPLLAPVGYRIPLRGRAPDVPLGPLASRLGYPGAASGRGRGRGRGRGKGKGRQRNRNRPRGGNKKGAAEPSVTVEEEKTTAAEAVENTGSEDKDDITDDNWQVISEEIDETDSPQPAQQAADNYVDFHNDMFDSDAGQSFSEPVLVIANETEAPAAAPTEEVTTEEVADEAAGTVEETTMREVITVEDTHTDNESQEVTILIDDNDEPVTNEQLTTDQSVPAAKDTKISEKPSPNITAITAPKASSPKETNKSNPYGSFHCEVCNVYCYQQKHMKQHLAGRRHRTNVEAQGKGRKLQNAAVTQKREAKKRERSESTGKQDSRGGSNNKPKHVSEAEKKYKAYMKSAVTCPGLSDAMQEFFRHREPLIGLKYAVEVAKSEDDPNPVYYCSICDEYFNSNVKLQHFTSVLHRKIVAKAEFPHKCLDMPKDMDEADIFRDIARDVEKEVGRQVHLIRRKVVTTDPISADGELLSKKRSDRTVKALLDLPPKDYLLEGPTHKAPLLEPHDRVVRVVPPSLKREREIGTWSPPPPAKRRNLLEPHDRFAADDIGYRSFEAPPDLLSGPLPHHMDTGLPARPPLLPSREEPMDSRMFRQNVTAPKPLLSLDLPPIMPSSSSMGASRISFSEQLRRMLDTMDILPVEELIRNEEDASIALHISNSLTKALLSFRMHSTSHVDRGELGSVYSMFSGGRH